MESTPNSRSLIFDMDQSAKRKQVVDDVFLATGEKMSPDDPLVIAALFYSHQMLQAGNVVTADLERLAADIRAAAQKALPDNGAADATRAKLMRDIESQITRCIKTASAGGGRNEHPYVPAWYALAGAVVGAFLIAAAWVVGMERGSVQADEAAVGRSFTRVVSTMDPKLKAQLMDHLRRTPD